MKQICDVCHGHRCVSVPGTGFWFLRKKVVCSACKGTGHGKPPDPPPIGRVGISRFRPNTLESEKQCYLCEGHDQVLRVTATTHSPDVGGIREVVCEDMDLCRHCRQKLNENLIQFKITIIHRMLLNKILFPSGSHQPNMRSEERRIDEPALHIL